MKNIINIITVHLCLGTTRHSLGIKRTGTMVIGYYALKNKKIDRCWSRILLLLW
jgi:hypothetical protein